MTNRKQFIHFKKHKLAIARDALSSVEIVAPCTLQLNYGKDNKINFAYKNDKRAEEVFNAITYWSSDIETLVVD